MPTNQGIIHPSMLAWLEPNFYPSRLTVQTAVESRSPTGAIIWTWTDAAGMIDLPCRIAPQSGSEQRTPQQVLTQSLQTCVVPVFLEITTKDRVKVDSVIYDVTSVDTDGQTVNGIPKTTRLTLKVVS